MEGLLLYISYAFIIAVFGYGVLLLVALILDWISDRIDDFKNKRK
jgi:hypothetical protein